MTSTAPTKVLKIGSVAGTLAQELLSINQEIKALEEEARQKKSQLLSYMDRYGHTSCKCGSALAVVVDNPQWHYSPKIKVMEDKLKAAKVMEQVSGLASQTPRRHIRIQLTSPI